MSDETARRGVGKKVYWLGWTLSIIVALMLLMSGVMKFFKPDGMQEGMDHLGWSMGLANTLGILETASTIIYLIPRTAVIGAILLTGYMGGAIATHVRVGDPFIVQALVGVVIWLGIWLRDPRLRDLIPVVRN